MGRLFLITLEGNIYSCKHCQTHFGLSEDILSKELSLVLLEVVGSNQPPCKPGVRLPRYFPSPDPTVWELRHWSFHCKHGKAYLFDKVVNVTFGDKEERMMMTGMHIVVDIFCVGCGSIVGWKYEAAHEKSQKYKEGKFILERFKILGPDGSHYMDQEAQIGGSDPDDA